MSGVRTQKIQIKSQSRSLVRSTKNIYRVKHISDIHVLLIFPKKSLVHWIKKWNDISKKLTLFFYWLCGLNSSQNGTVFFPALWKVTFCTVRNMPVWDYSSDKCFSGIKHVLCSLNVYLSKSRKIIRNLKTLKEMIKLQVARNSIYWKHKFQNC